jgi:Tol biopolymer transport system component
MSPEQARGGTADKRSDIWSFGVVLYEMLAGRQSFAGETISDTLAAVLKTDPDWLSLPTETPQAIRRLLRRCLERDRNKRLHDIADARLEIDEALTAPAEAPAAVNVPESRGIHPWWLAVVAVLALAGVAVGVMHFREQAAVPPVMRFQVYVPPSISRLAVSPNGLNLAFVAGDAEGRPALWNRSLQSLETRMLTHADQLSCVFWSADSRWIAFVADGKLKKIEATGGPPQTLCSINGAVPGGAWNREGVVLFGSLPSGGGIYKVLQAGGEPVRVTAADGQNGVSAHAWPQFLPDGRHFIYFAYSTASEKTAIELGALDTRQSKRLMPTSYFGTYVPPASGAANGHLLFLKEGTLMAQTLDSRSFDLTGEALPVADQVSRFSSYGFFSASETGVLAYRSGGDESSARQLQWFDRAGKELEKLGSPGSYGNVALAPDGKLAAVENVSNGNRDLWLIDVQRATSTRFTTDPADDRAPVWSPNGNRIFFVSGRPGMRIYEKESSGVAAESLLRKSDLSEWPYSLSPDGRLLLFAVNDPKTLQDLWILPLGGERKPVPFVQTPFREIQGQFSPTGAGPQRWVAYSSNDSGAFEVYVQSYPIGRKYPISKGGGVMPRWRPDGRELFYLGPGGALMSVEVKSSPRFEASMPRTLFQTRMPPQLSTPWAFYYAVAPDGNRFLINTVGTGAEQQAVVTVVLNWQAGIGARR